jgi:hypothetical protein
MNAKEKYIASRNTLRKLESAIRNEEDTKVVNKFFKEFASEYKESQELYTREPKKKTKRGVPMYNPATGKTTYAKKKRKNAPRMIITEY